MTAPRKTPLADRTFPALVISVLLWLFRGEKKSYK
jgi:hypothetical protein